ncbi:hypothetical protein ABG067_004179 [Albugo candida]
MYTTYILGVNMTSAATKSSVKRLCRSRTQYIPKGKVATYGKIARMLHSSPRSVGQALKRNPFAPVIPCHRVIASDGKIGGFQGSIDVTSASVSQKRRLLISEGVVFKQEYQVDPICMHTFQGESFDCNMDAQVL